MLAFLFARIDSFCVSLFLAFCFLFAFLSFQPLPLLFFRCYFAMKYLVFRSRCVHAHGCTAVGDGNTSPITKLYEFCHLLPTVQIFSSCLMHCMHGRIQKVKDKVMANDHRSQLPTFCNIQKKKIINKKKSFSITLSFTFCILPCILCIKQGEKICTVGSR